MSWFKKLFLILGIFLFFAIVPYNVLAKKTIGDAQANLEVFADRTGIEKTDTTTYSAKIITIGFSVTGVLFLSLMVYAGFKWMIARGNEEHVKKAMNTMIGATIGLCVVVGSYAITDYMTKKLVNAQKGGATGQGQSSPDKVGGEMTGCCADRVGKYVWACSIKTQNACMESCNTAVNEADPVGTSSENCSWNGDLKWVECEKVCEELND
jgi:hypothetical protein